jgi:hypothetical protein
VSDRVPARVRKDEGRDRRAHARQRGVAGRGPSDLAVRVADGDDERPREMRGPAGRFPVLTEPLSQDADGEPARDLAGRMAAEAVGHREGARPGNGEVRILVLGSHPPDVRACGVT